MGTYSRAQLDYIIQFAHNEKVASGQEGVFNDEILGALWKLSALDYRAILDGFATRARQAARELLDEDEFARGVDRLPFSPGCTIAAAGDSITDDLQSWAEIFRHVLALRRPKDQIVLSNLAVSGDTTTHMLARFLNVIDIHPDWIFCLIGTNDARRHGIPPFGTLVSPAETARNLAALRHYAAAQSRARWVWMTPPTVVEGRTYEHWFLGPMQIGWLNADLHAVAEQVRRVPDWVVDLQSAFGNPVDPHLLLDDGLHPSLAGQKLILRSLVAVLAG
jgi:acyl-CoA thioesterase-1